LDPYIPEKIEINKTSAEKVENNRFFISNFRYDEENDEFVCHENQKLKFVHEGYEKERKREYKLYTGIECKNVNLAKAVQKERKELGI
jgi:transposase